MTTTTSLTGTNQTGASALRDLTGGSRAPSSDVSNSRSAATGPAVVVDLSATAKAASGAASSTKDFATVAKDARSALDASYTKSGKIASIYTTGAEWKDMTRGMDRRTLYAIKSNEGGQFSAVEQDAAKTEMMERLKDDTGLQTSMKLLDNSFPSSLKNAVNYLDNVSDEEKSSFDWAHDRALWQSNYELASQGEGQEPEKLDSTNPLVKMIKAGLDGLNGLIKSGDLSKKLEDMPQYKQAQQLFASQQSGASSAVDIRA